MPFSRPAIEYSHYIDCGDTLLIFFKVDGKQAMVSHSKSTGRYASPKGSDEFGREGLSNAQSTALSLAAYEFVTEYNRYNNELKGEA